MEYTSTRKPFILHMKGSLLKPIMIVSTTGYIVACIGPFLFDCSNNDASMIKSILLENIENILGWIQEVDHQFSNTINSSQLFLERYRRRRQRLQGRYRYDVKSRSRRCHAAIPQSSTTVHHTRVE